MSQKSKMSQKSGVAKIENEETRHAYIVYDCSNTMVIAVCTSKEHAMKIMNVKNREGGCFIKKAPFNKFHEITDIDDDIVYPL